MRDQYNHLTFIRDIERRATGGHIKGLWLCDCGVEKELSNSRVRRGYIKSCGCQSNMVPGNKTKRQFLAELSKHPTPEMLCKMLRFEPETGKLFWRKRSRQYFMTDSSHKTWNTRYAKKEAFTTNVRGYLMGRLLGRIYSAHRIVWAISTGEWPVDEVDHINHVPSDNRIANLRVVSHQENLRNQPMRSNNTSGVCGVFWDGEKKRWSAQIKHKRNSIYLGTYHNIEDAAAARKTAESKFGFHANHGVPVNE